MRDSFSLASLVICMEWVGEWLTIHRITRVIKLLFEKKARNVIENQAKPRKVSHIYLYIL